MNTYALYHLSDIPFAYAENEDTLVVRIRAAKGDLSICILRYKDRFDERSPFASMAMRIKGSTVLFDFWEAQLSLETNRYRYFFELRDQSGEILYYGERGVQKELPHGPGAFQFPYIAKADVYKAVQWGQEGIVYQIFPDRFANGDRSNDPEGVRPWGDDVTQDSLFGGDLQGIIDRIPYLKELGTTCLYLTPIFLSSSNHKYNTDDYFQIDPRFGDLATVKNLVNTCHRNGIQMVFDAVFNHCGKEFFAFQDVLRYGERSRYRDWFFIKDFPVDTRRVNYTTFGVRSAYMPKLNTANPEVKAYLLGLTAYWMKTAEIDGWRLDVSDEIDHAFWRDFRKTVKQINPKAIIVGEVMHEASAYLRGEQMDATMNYPFREAAVRFFAQRTISAKQFEEELFANRMLYMDAINRNMWNLIDSHDTERFLTLCGNRIERLECVAVFQFTYIGTPYIYYGDEVGLDGGQDPQCRKCMIWETEKQNIELLSLYHALCKIRTTQPCLVYGEYESLSQNDILAFARTYANERIVVFINHNDEPKVLCNDVLKGDYIDLMSGTTREIDGKVRLEPHAFFILKLQ
ncbi:MAG: alpha-glycosidase [Ethanoligenens sp.]